MEEESKARKSDQNASGAPTRSSGRHAQPSKRLLDADFTYESVKRSRKSNAELGASLHTTSLESESSHSLVHGLSYGGDYTPSTKKKSRARETSHDLSDRFSNSQSSAFGLDTSSSLPVFGGLDSQLGAQSTFYSQPTSSSHRYDQSAGPPASFEQPLAGANRQSGTKIKMRFGKKQSSDSSSNQFGITTSFGGMPPQSDSLSFGLGGDRSGASRLGMPFEGNSPGQLGIFDLPVLSNRSGSLMQSSADSEVHDSLLDSALDASGFGVPHLPFSSDYNTGAFGEGTSFGSSAIGGNHNNEDSSSRSHSRSRRQDSSRGAADTAAARNSSTGFNFVAPPSGLKISLFGRRSNATATASAAANESRVEAENKRLGDAVVTPKHEADSQRTAVTPAIDYTLDYDAARLNDDDDFDDDDFDLEGLEAIPMRDAGARISPKKKTGRKGGKWKKRRKRPEAAADFDSFFDDSRHMDPDFVYSSRAGASQAALNMRINSHQPLIKAGGYNVEADWRCAICDRFAAEIVGRKNQVAVPDRYRLIYYGVPTCKGCQVFFRKMIMEMKLKGQLYGTIPCPNAGTCTLLAGVGFCVACRFNRCVNSFPPPDALKPQRTPEGEIAKTVLEKPLLDKVNRESETELAPYLRMRPRVSFGSASSTLHRAGRNSSNSSKALPRRAPVRVGTQVKLEMPGASFSFLPSLADVGAGDRQADARSTDSAPGSQQATVSKATTDSAPQKQKTERDLHFYKELSAMYQSLVGLRDGHPEAFEYDSDSHSDSTDFEEPDDLLKKLVGVVPLSSGASDDQKVLSGDTITATLARDDVLELIAGRLGAESECPKGTTRSKRIASPSVSETEPEASAVTTGSRHRPITARRADANRNEAQAPNALIELLGAPKAICTNRSINRGSAFVMAREVAGRFYTELQMNQYCFTRRTAQLIASRRAVRQAITLSNKNQRSSRVKQTDKPIRPVPTCTTAPKPSTHLNSIQQQFEAEQPQSVDEMCESVKRMHRAIENRIGVAHDVAVARMRHVVRRCHSCAACVSPDCGRCRACLDKPHLGGRNVLRQSCYNRICLNAQLAKGVETAAFRAKELRRQRVLASSVDAEKERDAKLACELDAEADADVKTEADVPDADADAKPKKQEKRRLRSSSRSKATAAASSQDAGHEEPQRVAVSTRLDELDGVDVWDTGMALVAHKDNLPPMNSTLCYLCGAVCRQPLVCVGCCEPFDWFCIAESERPQDATEITSWCCRRCRVCAVCTKSKYLRTCASCHKHFHPHCIAKHYPRRLGEDGCWLCAECAVCSGCDRRAADDPDSWSEQFDFCKPCSALMQRGNYCPICRKTYRDDDYSAKMVQCSKCRKWIHATCQHMSDEQYEMFAQLPEEQAPYKCDPCSLDELRAAHPTAHTKAAINDLSSYREWPRIIDEHMYEGLLAVVDEITADDGAHKSGTDAARGRYDDDDADDWLSRNAIADDDADLDEFGRGSGKPRKDGKSKKKSSSRRYADEFDDLERDDMFDDDGDAFDDDDDDEYSPRKRSDAASAHRSARKGSKHRRGATESKKHSHRHHHRSRYSDTESASDDERYEFGKRRPVGVSGTYRQPASGSQRSGGHQKSQMMSSSFRAPFGNPMASGAPDDELGLFAFATESLNNAVSFASGSLAQFDGTVDAEVCETFVRMRVLVQVDGAGDDDEEHEGAAYNSSMNINNFLSMFDFMVAPSTSGAATSAPSAGAADADAADALHDDASATNFLNVLPDSAGSDYLPATSAESLYAPAYMSPGQGQTQASRNRNRKSLEMMEGNAAGASLDFELGTSVDAMRAGGEAAFVTSDWTAGPEPVRSQTLSRAPMQANVAASMRGRPNFGQPAQAPIASIDSLKKVSTGFKPSDALKTGGLHKSEAKAGQAANPAGSAVVDEEAYFGVKPRDFFQIREKIERHEYRTVAEFCDDLIRIIQRRLLIARDSTPDVQSHTLWVKVTFTKAMRRAFAWFNVDERPAWTASRFPVDLIPHATIPPYQDHSYSKYRDAHEAPVTRSNRERRAAQQTAAQNQPDARTMAIINTARLEGEARLVRLEEEEERKLASESSGEMDSNSADKLPGADVSDSKTDIAGVPSSAGSRLKGDAESGQTVPTDVAKQMEDQPVDVDWSAALASVSPSIYCAAADADRASVSDDRTCILCHVHGDQLPRAGDRLLSFGAGVWVHVNCAIWSSRCTEVRMPDMHGGYSSTLLNVEDCIVEGVGAVCDACSQSGATVRCARSGCSHAFHFPCATKRDGCRFESNYRMFCDLHAPNVSDSSDFEAMFRSDSDPPMQLTSENQFAVNRSVRLPNSSRRSSAVVDLVRSVWPKYCGTGATQEQCVPDGSTVPADDVRVVVGGLAVTSLGKVVRASNRSDYLRPLGFTSTRLFWSAQSATRLVRYVNRIVPATADRVALLRDLQVYESGLASKEVVASKAEQSEAASTAVVPVPRRRDAEEPEKPDNHVDLCDSCTLGTCVSMATVLTNQPFAFIGASHSFSGSGRHAAGSLRQSASASGSQFRASFAAKAASAQSGGNPRFNAPNTTAYRRVAVPAQAHSLQAQGQAQTQVYSLGAQPQQVAIGQQPKMLAKATAGAILPRAAAPSGGRMVTPITSTAMRPVATAAASGGALIGAPSAVRIVQFQKQPQPQQQHQQQQQLQHQVQQHYQQQSAVTLRIQQPQAAANAPIAIRPKPLISVVVPRAAGSTASVVQPIRGGQPVVGRVQAPVRQINMGQMTRPVGVRAPVAGTGMMGVMRASAPQAVSNVETVIEQKTVEPVLSDTDFLDLLANDDAGANRGELAGADDSQEIVATSLANIIVETLPVEEISVSSQLESGQHADSQQSGGGNQVSCSSCSRVFNSQAAFQQHVLVCAASVFGEDGGAAMDVDAAGDDHSTDRMPQLDGVADLVDDSAAQNALAGDKAQLDDLDVDRVELLYEVASEDGYRVLARDPFTAWQTVLHRINERREQATLQPVSFHAVNGATLFGLANRRVIQLVEQLPGRRNAYPARYYAPGESDSSEDAELEGDADERARLHEAGEKPVTTESQPLASSSRTLPHEDGKTRSRDTLMFLRNAQRTDAHMMLPSQVVRAGAGDAELGGLAASGVSSALLKYRTWSTRELHSRLVVLRSPIHGRGLFAARVFADGESICELRGELVRTIVADKRAREYEQRGVVPFYFRVDRETVLDATKRGSLARFVNHSCSPNCSIKVVTIESRKRLVLVAIRKIAKNEELSCDYRNVEYRSPTERTRNVPCTCGSKKCSKLLAIAVGGNN